jgi:unsaturated rhamnogalacturonyl hydrolase
MHRLGILLSLALMALPAVAAESSYIGMAPKGARIEALMVPGASATSPTVLLIGGIKGEQDVARVVSQEIRKFEAIRQDRRQFKLLAIPLANPEASTLVFPPAGPAYRENPESHALWRWIAIQAPDIVLIATADADYGLADALAGSAVAGVGRTAARLVAAREGLLDPILALKEIPRSEARREIERRLARSPRAVADELAKVYGREFNDLTYIPGMGLIGQLRLGRTADVQSLVAPFVDGPKAGPPGRPVSGNLAGYLVFAELAERTGDKRYLQMVKDAAGVGFTESGEMKESMGASNGMSDGVFMSIPILGKAFKLTREAKYCEMAARHLAFMQNLDLRPDGLYRHSPTSDNVAWGRGNAFPALGLSYVLTDCPKDTAAFNTMLRQFQQHIEVLARFQDQAGLWHQVIDEPASYAEFTATAMIGIAMLRGVRSGWLDARTYQPRIDRAWKAVLARIASNGDLMDVCESTNKQATLRDYLHREAILGRDIRGGGMAMIFATELAGLQ